MNEQPKNRERLDAAAYEEEACLWCEGDGCDACNDTGLLYTENAIRLQVEASEREDAAS